MDLKLLAKKILPKPLWNQMRLKKLRNSVKNYHSRVVCHNYGAHKLKVQIADPLSEGWYDHDWGVQSEIEFLKQSRLKAGARIFDFGAHQSVVAMMLAKEVGETGEVHALEANPHNFKTGLENKKLNSLDNLHIHQMAVSNQNGTLSFNEGLNGSINSDNKDWGEITVSSITIDSMSEKYGQPDVIFLDIEGAEYLALLGASKTLQTPCDWFVEVHGKDHIEPFGGTVEKTLSFFTENGFTCFMQLANSETFIPLDQARPEIQERFYLIAKK